MNLLKIGVSLLAPFTGFSGLCLDEEKSEIVADFFASAFFGTATVALADWFFGVAFVEDDPPKKEKGAGFLDSIGAGVEADGCGLTVFFGVDPPKMERVGDFLGAGFEAVGAVFFGAASLAGLLVAGVDPKMERVGDFFGTGLETVGVLSTRDDDPKTVRVGAFLGAGLAGTNGFAFEAGFNFWVKGFTGVFFLGAGFAAKIVGDFLGAGFAIEIVGDFFGAGLAGTNFSAFGTVLTSFFVGPPKIEKPEGLEAETGSITGSGSVSTFLGVAPKKEKAEVFFTGSGVGSGTGSGTGLGSFGSVGEKKEKKGAGLEAGVGAGTGSGSGSGVTSLALAELCPMPKRLLKASVTGSAVSTSGTTFPVETDLTIGSEGSSVLIAAGVEANNDPKTFEDVFAGLTSGSGLLSTTGSGLTSTLAGDGVDLKSEPKTFIEEPVDGGVIKLVKDINTFRLPNILPFLDSSLIGDSVSTTTGLGSCSTLGVTGFALAFDFVAGFGEKRLPTLKLPLFFGAAFFDKDFGFSISMLTAASAAAKAAAAPASAAIVALLYYKEAYIKYTHEKVERKIFLPL